MTFLSTKTLVFFFHDKKHQDAYMHFMDAILYNRIFLHHWENMPFDHSISETTLRKITYPRARLSYIYSFAGSFLDGQWHLPNLSQIHSNLRPQSMIHPHFTPLAPFDSFSTYDSFFSWNQQFHKAIRKMEKERKKEKVFNLEYISPYPGDLEMSYEYD